MRWKQRTYTKNDIIYVETYETVSPFRKFTQNPNKYRSNWELPSGIDNLVLSMEKAREDKNWEVADTIRKSLTEMGIVVRNGKDWYPTPIENEIKAEKDFLSWLYSNLVSGNKTTESAKKTIEFFENDIKKEYDI